MNMEDNEAIENDWKKVNEAIENDWKKVNLELFGVQYPFCSSNEATHGKDD